MEINKKLCFKGKPGKDLIILLHPNIQCIGTPMFLNEAVVIKGDVPVIIKAMITDPFVYLGWFPEGSEIMGVKRVGKKKMLVNFYEEIADLVRQMITWSTGGSLN